MPLPAKRQARLSVLLTIRTRYFRATPNRDWRMSTTGADTGPQIVESNQSTALSAREGIIRSSSEGAGIPKYIRCVADKLREFRSGRPPRGWSARSCG